MIRLHRKLCGVIGDRLKFIWIVMGNYREIVGFVVNLVNIIGNCVVFLWKSSVIDMDSHGEIMVELWGSWLIW